MTHDEYRRYLEKKEFLYETACRWTENMILSGVIRLQDVPRELRVSEERIYVAALRVTRAVNCKWFVQDLRLLYLDILSLDRDSRERRALMNLFEEALRFNVKTYKGEKEFVDFQESLCEDVLQELHQMRGATQRALREQYEALKADRRKTNPEQPSSV